MDSEEKYGVPKEFQLNGTIFDMLNKPNATLKVCLFNENPNSPLGKVYLDRLEADFKDGLYSWLAVATEHAAWKGPSEPKIDFLRVDAGILIKAIGNIRQRLDPDILAKIKSYINGPHLDFKESIARYRRIAESIDLNSFKDAGNFECDGGVSIIGLTSESAARILQSHTQNFGEDLFFLDEVLAKRLKDLWIRLKVEELTNRKESEKLKERLLKFDLGGDLWSRAFVIYRDPIISIGLPSYLIAQSEIDNFRGKILSLSRSEDRWLMNHEIGHLFLLKDVYVEDETAGALNKHPNALMGDHRLAKGAIQVDDKKGLFSILDNLDSGKITSCSKDYKVWIIAMIFERVVVNNFFVFLISHFRVNEI